MTTDYAEHIAEALLEFGCYTMSRDARYALAGSLAKGGAKPGDVRRFLALASEAGTPTGALCGRLQDGSWRDAYEDLRAARAAQDRRSATPEPNGGQALRDENRTRLEGLGGDDHDFQRGRHRRMAWAIVRQDHRSFAEAARAIGCDVTEVSELLAEAEAEIAEERAELNRQRGEKRGAL